MTSSSTALRAAQADAPLAVQAQRWLTNRLRKLDKKSPEYRVLERIHPFRFADYPDYTIPWHLLMWPHQRWAHVLDVVHIIELLRHAKGSAAKGGGRIRLEPFQALILLCFLGPEDPKTHLRLVREGLLTISRKNAKSTLVAGIALALMVLHHEHGGLKGQEVYVGASDRQQAGIIFDVCSKFIAADDRMNLPEVFRVVPSRKHIVHKGTLTELQVLSSDAYRSHGLNPSVVILDELGNIPAQQAEDFYGVLTSGFGAQDEPLTLLLSTQAASDTHLFSTMVDRCKRVNEGVETAPSVAGFVFETPENFQDNKIDAHDKRWWYLSNPGLGMIVSIQDMEEESKKASALPSLESKFRNLRLNQRANPFNPLISKSIWQACSGPVDPEDLIGRKCWIGIDLAMTTDLTALVVVFEPDEQGVRPVVAHFWVPGDGLEERQNRDRVPYELWSRQGLIDTSSHRTVDYGLIAEQIRVYMDDYALQAVAFDRWKINDLKASMRFIGLEDLVDDESKFFAVGQGYKDASPTVAALETALLEGRVAHGGNPILTWCASNACVVTDPAGNRKFDKSKSYGRIDGVVALAMALRAIELQAQVETGPSAFETDACLM